MDAAMRIFSEEKLMPEKFEALSAEDLAHLDDQLDHAGDLVFSITTARLDGTLNDLSLLQRVLDSKAIEPEAEYSLLSMGLAFGRVFINHNPDYHWWMLEDEYGRDPVVRLKETGLMVSPNTMLLRRVEDGEEFEVVGLYEDMLEDLEAIRRENFSDE
jgi:hypothetical protein